ncbi:hypothetical protein JYU34_020999 [Plutella xylostella]|uniref:C2 domain-containing protein n=1 Tax=Plutella xylostella TaxID=51655 RepID=A0ABQ7PTU1_PLUXY|nr:hypothetical protein JYU34_020999 [Plutella xylostella]
MAESVELKSLRKYKKSTSDSIEEYNDSNYEESTEFAALTLEKSTNEYNFFTEVDVKTTQKIKKKRAKKKERHSNLMDIINSELAAVEIPIEKNVINKMDFSKEQQATYMDPGPKVLDIFQRRYQWATDAEEGWETNSSCKLNPIFPKVLEQSTATESNFIPVEYVKPNHFDKLALDTENTAQAPTKFVDVEIGNIKFKYHHHFTLEDLLVQKLLTVYDGYVDIQRFIKRTIKNIQVNRETIDNLKRDLYKISPKKDEVKFDPTIRKYMAQMIESKDIYMETLKKEKETLNDIISIWSDLETVRERNGQLTSYALEISTFTLKEEEYEMEWKNVFDEELNYLLEKMEFEFVCKYIEYKEYKNTFEKISKPKLHVDEEIVKNEAEGNTNKIVRKDKINIKLKIVDVDKRHTKTSAEYNPKINYHFKVHVDDLFVCESDHYLCKKDYNLEFTEHYSVQILPENVFILLALYENNDEVAQVKMYLSEISKKGTSSEFNTVEFMFSNIIEPNAKYIGCGFSIKEIAAANKVRLKSSNLFKGNIYTTCETQVKMTLNDELKDSNQEDFQSYVRLSTKIERLLNGTEQATIDLLTEIIEKIYDQDISKNEEMMNTLNNICHLKVRIDDDFDLDENSTEFIRIKLLHLRDKGELSHADNKSVPFYASQITTEQLNSLQRSKHKDFDINNFNADKYTDMHPIELKRYIGSKYVEKLNQNLIKTLSDTLLKKTYKDVVCDFRDLSIRGLFSNQSSFISKSTGATTKNLQESISKDQEIHVTILRAFNLPDRTPCIMTEEEIADEQEESIAGYKVRSLRPFVKISYRGVHAQTGAAIGSYPTWNQTLKLVVKPGLLSSIYINLYDEQKVNISESYVEDSSFQSKTLHYRCHNKWLGMLELPLYSVLAFGKIKGTFKINMPSLLLGYENHDGKKESSRSLIPEVTQLMRKESSFISLQISTKSGQGFNHRYDLPTVNNNEDDYIIKHLNNFVTEYLMDFPTRNISLTFIDSAGKNKCITQYLQPIPLPDYECFPKNPKRSESAVSKSSNLSKSSSSKSAEYKRNVDLEKGQEIEKESLYSSYEGRNWKKTDNPLEKMMNAALRYVSLIPCYEVNESHVVTLMGVELLKILHGSPLDHTILLASYFLYLGLKTFVAIGQGLPRGRSSYVLTKYDLRLHRMVTSTDQWTSKAGFLSRNSGFVWYVYDAVKGERFEFRDVSCPLKSVDYVFDNENIWVNVQSAQDCESVTFEFSKSSDWSPVFDKNIFIMKNPIVNDSNLYKTPPNLEELRNALENKLKLKIQKWRSHTKTIWNRYCSSLFREMLPQWEYWALSPSEPRPPLGQRMRQLMVTYKVYGFPMNLPFVNTKAVVAAIKSTNVHVYDDPNAEFGLAVEMYAYPNDVISVWVFLASVSRI